MVELTPIAAELAEKLATAKGLSIEAVIQDALEQSARQSGLADRPVRRKEISAERLLALGAEIAALPLLDKRSSEEILDDLMPL